MDHGLTTQYIIHPQCLADKIEEFDIENASIKNLSKAIIKKLARKLSALLLFDFSKNKKVIFLTKTNWDYYLHPYRTLYAKELSNLGNNVFWINEPTKNPIKFLFCLFNEPRSKVRIFTPFLLTPTLLHLNWINSAILSLQLFWICGSLNSNKTILWSVYCSHYNFIKRYPESFKIYWPGDLFDIQKEQKIIKVYDLVMPLSEINR